MLATSIDFPTLAMVLAGALIAGFTTGFAGFGTALVASGLWFHALPAAMVPPLVVMASVAAQLVGLVAVRKAFDWQAAFPYIVGGVVGVPFGIAALAAASPLFLRTSIGLFLIAYAARQLMRRRQHTIGVWGGRVADGAIGFGGGFLGGFAGLSGPLPLIWLQLRGGETERQRAIYQPFNLVVLGLAGIGMSMSGQMTADVVRIALLCMPVTLVGAWIGARLYSGVSAKTFHRVVLCLLLVSGCILIGQSIAR